MGANGSHHHRCSAKDVAGQVLVLACNSQLCITDLSDLQWGLKCVVGCRSLKTVGVVLFQLLLDGGAAYGSYNSARLETFGLD